VQKPTQALQSAKGAGNTFDLNLKWTRTFPSLIYFSWNIHRDPPPQNKIQISKLIFDTLLWCRNPPRHFSQLKAREIPLIETPSGKELCRPSKFFHGLFIVSPPPNRNIKVVYRDSSRHISGGSKGERAIAYALLEVTSPEAALNGNDVT
jgi:hypothetical protein